MFREQWADKPGWSRAGDERRAESDKQPVASEIGRRSFLKGSAYGRLSNPKWSALNTCT